MRAVNLIPLEERRGRGGGAGRSGGAAYVLLGVLALLVVLAGMTATQRRSLADKRTELAGVEATATQAEARTAGLGDFTKFSALRTSRVDTVTSLASSRFDWSHSLREIARVIPADVWLTNLVGTVAPGVTPKAGGGTTTTSLRSAVSSPAIELAGCAAKQDSVARMVVRMRLVDGVSRVALQSSVATDAAAGSSSAGDSAGGGGTNGDCRPGTPKFALVMFLDQAAGAVPTAATRRVPTSFGPPTGPTSTAGPTP